MNSLVDDKFYKNYKRWLLTDSIGHLVVLTGNYKATWEKHVTFTTIRPYIHGCKTKTICNHVNLYREDVEKVIDIADLVKNNKYYIIGYCEYYHHSDRVGIKLAVGEGYCPIIKASDFKGIPSEIISVCYQFDCVQYSKN